MADQQGKSFFTFRGVEYDINDLIMKTKAAHWRTLKGRLGLGTDLQLADGTQPPQEDMLLALGYLAARQAGFSSVTFEEIDEEVCLADIRNEGDEDDEDEPLPAEAGDPTSALTASVQG